MRKGGKGLIKDRSDETQGEVCREQHNDPYKYICKDVPVYDALLRPCFNPETSSTGTSSTTFGTTAFFSVLFTIYHRKCFDFFGHSSYSLPVEYKCLYLDII